MKKLMALAGALALCLVSFDHAADKPAARTKELKTFAIPYRLTDTNHVMVRAKINGKGPYNFILDTGAPALFVATAVCRRLEVEPDAKGWGTFERFEIEGGAVIEKAKGRVETPFQLEGMNGLGLAGATLHGIIGYNILARYRLEFDFTKDKLQWTELDFDPPTPKPLGAGKSSAGGIEVLGQVMKVLGAFLGKKAAPDTKPRGFLGIELAEVEGGVEVKTVLANSPADESGLKTGDRIKSFHGRQIEDISDVMKRAGSVTARTKVDVTIERNGETKTLTIQAGEGL